MPATKVVTLGYGNRSLEELARLLQRAAARELVDVRSIPFSRHRPDLNASAASLWLATFGVDYRSDPRLGGKPSRPSHTLPNGMPNYDEMCKEGEYQTALRALADSGAVVALMCAELDPLRCHRYHLIAADLAAFKAVDIVHVGKDGTLVPHVDLVKLSQDAQISAFPAPRTVRK